MKDRGKTDWQLLQTRFDKLISALLVSVHKFCTKNTNAEWSLQLRYLKYPWNHRIVPPWPHLFDNICVGFCNFTLHAQRVGEVQLLQIRIHQEVLSQWWRVTQTLWKKNAHFTLKKFFCKRYMTACLAVHDLWPVKLSSWSRCCPGSWGHTLLEALDTSPRQQSSAWRHKIPYQFQIFKKL